MPSEMRTLGRRRELGWSACARAASPAAATARHTSESPVALVRVGVLSGPNRPSRLERFTPGRVKLLNFSPEALLHIEPRHRLRAHHEMSAAAAHIVDRRAAFLERHTGLAPTRTRVARLDRLR